jgi:hypothetical protein
MRFVSIKAGYHLVCMTDREESPFDTRHVKVYATYEPTSTKKGLYA